MNGRLRVAVVIGVVLASNIVWAPIHLDVSGSSQGDNYITYIINQGAYYVEGIGTQFSIRYSNFANVTLNSTQNIKVYMESIPKIDPMMYALVYAPLEEAQFDPDVIVIIANPAQAMKLSQAWFTLWVDA